MATFEFQEALSEKGLKQKDLPDNLKEQIKNLEKYARSFSDDLSEEEEDTLLEKIDYIDSQIAKAIRELGQEKPTEKSEVVSEKDSKEGEEAKSGSNGGFGLVLGFFAIVATVVTWNAVKNK